MSYAYRLLQQAHIDLADAYIWYENEQTGLGEKFSASVNDKISSIITHPLWYGSKKKGYRETKVSNTFPYVIVYKFYPRKNEIIIVAICHAKRNPKNKYRK